MSVLLWELFENIFTFVVPEVEKPKESIRVEVRWGREVPGVVRFHHLLSATGPLSLRPSVHRPFVHRPIFHNSRSLPAEPTRAVCQKNIGVGTKKLSENQFKVAFLLQFGDFCEKLKKY